MIYWNVATNAFCFCFCFRVSFINFERKSHSHRMHFSIHFNRTLTEFNHVQATLTKTKWFNLSAWLHRSSLISCIKLHSHSIPSQIGSRCHFLNSNTWNDAANHPSEMIFLWVWPKSVIIFFFLNTIQHRMSYPLNVQVHIRAHMSIIPARSSPSAGKLFTVRSTIVLFGQP